MLYYLALTFGELSNGLLSQVFRTRKKIIAVFMMLTMVSLRVLLPAGRPLPEPVLVVCFLLGWSSGYWAMFITVAAEQFGTNLRATVAVTAPNSCEASPPC